MAAFVKKLVHVATLAGLLAAGAVPHLTIHAGWHSGGDDHQFALFGEEDIKRAGTTTTLAQADHAGESADLYRLYSASVHAHVCFFAWLLSKHYPMSPVENPGRVRKWFRYFVCLTMVTALATAGGMIFLADSFTTEGVNFHVGLFGEGKDMERGYVVRGYRAAGAFYFFLSVPLVAVALFLHR
jgi:hypothetical protein